MNDSTDYAPPSPDLQARIRAFELGFRRGHVPYPSTGDLSGIAHLEDFYAGLHAGQSVYRGESGLTVRAENPRFAAARAAEGVAA